MSNALVLLTLLAHSGASQPPVAPSDPVHQSVATAYVPERVYDTRRKAFSDFEVMLADLARADVVIVGEQHDDPNTHRLESAILQGMMRRGVPVTLSLEMFERDVQPHVDAYVAGKLSEEEFLRQSRPWPRYPTDYRPLLEMARAHGWRVVASNIPRKYASAVAKSGMSALEALPPDERALVARESQCPLDNYFTRFSETMNSHPAPGSEKVSGEDRRATMERYYYSQCLKDETMAEAIAAAFEKSEGAPGSIVHYNGAFHSEFGAGVAERVRRRLPGRRIALVTILPVDNIDALAPDEEDLKRAEYLLYTVR